VKRSVVLWGIALVITLSSAVWQRLTGPTHPLRVQAEVAGLEVSGRLLRSQTVDESVPIELRAAPGLTGEAGWRRWPGEDHPWHTEPLRRDGERLVGELPAQTATAARIAYEVRLVAPGGEQVTIGARLRFKGAVPGPVLAVHIAAMFLGMLLSARTGLEALARGPRLAPLALATLVCLGLGGLLLGPIVQKYAFDAYWTGWPVGEDLTDNKLAVAVLAWALAAWQVRRGRRWPAMAASLVTFTIFMIPHSLHGSTHDWQTGRHIQAALPPVHGAPGVLLAQPGQHGLVVVEQG
jgi:hypothetical protein